MNRKTFLGFCKSPNTAMVSRAALHFWEEPCISGKRGSGTIFFNGCTLRCVFCQNSEISRDCLNATPFDARGLADVIKSLEDKGAHNINFVNPTHYTNAIIEALELYKPSIPIVWNTGGYERTETIDKLEGIVDVYLPDYKYADSELARRYSGAEDYPIVAENAIKRMIEQIGSPVFDAQGMMKKGVIIRHLILPGNVMNTLNVLKNILKLPKTMISIMAQYTPCNDLTDFPELNRKLTSSELERVYKFLEKNSIEGYIQSLESADTCFIPDFNSGIDI